ncbi:magnesium transporter CorA family protein [Candidatus Gracilibacteria bacterium 28_42_T64]|nr:magnesium transporter CorA family protein [Candidatus Gracilibacteria bacterium 28_42_T64]
MLKKQKINGIHWIDGVGLSDKDIVKTLEKYKIHELDLEACLEGNQRARVDKYDDYTFVVYHYPKYNRATKVYELNEFNMFLSKDFLITFREFPFSRINKVFENYGEKKVSGESKKLKISTGYILYEITQAMLEKMFNMIKNIKLDIKNLEKKVFEKGNSSLVKEIMIKKRNIVVLKHMFKPQVALLKQLEHIVNELYAGEMEVYFEDLEDKLDQILSDIDILAEYIDSVEDAFKAMIDIKTNFVLKVLAIFSAFLLPLTLITSFYGMNIELPTWTTPDFVYILLLGSVAIMFMVYLFLKKTGKF